MKTPDDIKKGLECCKPKWKGNLLAYCDGECAYRVEDKFCRNVLITDALAYIQQLESRLAQVERDAAIEKLKAYKCYEDESSFPKGMTQAEYFGITKDGVDD